MKRRILALVCALMLIALPALAVPSPNDDFYVLDQANVLSSETEWRIVYNNDLLYDACGAQIVFVTVDDTDGKAIDDYAYDLFNRWVPLLLCASAAPIIARLFDSVPPDVNTISLS